MGNGKGKAPKKVRKLWNATHKAREASHLAQEQMRKMREMEVDALRSPMVMPPMPFWATTIIRRPVEPEGKTIHWWNSTNNQYACGLDLVGISSTPNASRLLDQINCPRLLDDFCFSGVACSRLGNAHQASHR